jgi:hypothetical protein
MALREQQSARTQSQLELNRQQETRMAKAGQLDQKIKTRELLDTIGNSAAQSAYALVSTTEEGSMERKKGTAALIDQTRKRLQALGPDAGPSLEILDNTLKEMGPDALMNLEAARYGNALKAKRGAKTTTYKQPNTAFPVKKPDGSTGYVLGGATTLDSQGNIIARSPTGTEIFDTPEAAKSAIPQREAAIKSEEKQKMSTIESVTSAANEAAYSNQGLAQMETLLDQGLRTGPGADFAATLKGVMQFAGMDVSDDHKSNAEVFKKLSMDQVASRINQTKGAVSDSEMALFLRSVPTLATTPEGIDLIIEAMRQFNDAAIQRGKLANDLRDQPGRTFNKDFYSQDMALRGDYGRWKEDFFKRMKKVKGKARESFTWKDVISYSDTPTSQPTTQPATPQRIGGRTSNLQRLKDSGAN